MNEIRLSVAQANGIADTIAGLLLAEKETIIEAIQKEDEQALTDEIYYALRDC